MKDEGKRLASPFLEGLSPLICRSLISNLENKHFIKVKLNLDSYKHSKQLG